jgi:hypothetical protein
MPTIVDEFRASLNDAQYAEVLCIAVACHENNRLWCIAQGDTSQVPWSEAEDWQRTSAINGVFYALATGAGPEQLHENWMREKLQTGWLYGPVKDVAEKRHPCIVPYHELPGDQRAKDTIFQSTVHTWAKLFGFEIPTDPNGFSPATP